MILLNENEFIFIAAWKKNEGEYINLYKYLYKLRKNIIVNFILKYK